MILKTPLKVRIRSTSKSSRTASIDYTIPADSTISGVLRRDARWVIFTAAGWGDGNSASTEERPNISAEDIEAHGKRIKTRIAARSEFAKKFAAEHHDFDANELEALALLLAEVAEARKPSPAEGADGP